MALTETIPTFSSVNATTYKTVVASRDLEVVVGDEKQEAFYPRVKVKKWENEVNFSVGVISDESKESSQVLDAKGAVVWSQGTVDAKFYNLEDGFEFEVVLKEKPLTNVLMMSIETTGLDFFYQPFLTEQERLAMEISRPTNVEGSYAVYHNSKMNNKYQTGKAFHIYRPKIIDADGKWAWGELFIDAVAKTLSVTIPQSILDKGTYPLTVDPNFGWETIGDTGFLGVDYISGSIFAGAAGTGISISAYVSDPADGASLKCCVYESTDDKVLSAETEELTGIFSEAAPTVFHFVSAPTFSAQDYVIVLWGHGGKLNVCRTYYDAISSPANQGHRQALDYTTSWPDPATFTHNNDRCSIWVTYTEAAAGPALLKTVNGLAVASVKTLRSGLAIASGKTFNGLA
jgi:hypothetical protein